MRDAETILTDCERYWRAAGIGRRRAEEMRAELAGHLAEAQANGRAPETVVGDDVAAFARAWAEAVAPDGRALPRWEVTVHRRAPLRLRAVYVAILMSVVVAVVIWVATVGDEGSSSMDDEMWRWIWLGAAVFLGFAEMFTAGFFMLPFAGGAVVAFVLALFDVEPAIQLVAFIVASLIALWWVMTYVKHEDEEPIRVGANRLLDQHAVVLEPIDRTTGSGRVRMETELWRATTDGPPIESGTEVRVLGVRGARLVVVPVEGDSEERNE
ncbi:MAG TPA: NfeD family protein [Acidimicrobiia bacterium]|nr:NfeD family protein [Acidimicrobiia bacterium]